MSQATLIVGGIILAFIAWATLQGHLGNYLADLGLGGAGGAMPSTSGNTGVINTTQGVGGLFGGGTFFNLGTGQSGFSQLPTIVNGGFGGVTF